MATTRSRGFQAESEALDHLKAHGCQLINCNYGTKAGEIDIIVNDCGVLVFVEVRYRRSTKRGTGAESITAKKKRRIIRTAEHFLVTHKSYQDMPCRFDVLSIKGSIDGTTNNSIDWIRRAFTLDA